MSNLRILIATEAPIPHAGGMSTHVLLLRKKLIERGYEVDILDGKKLRSNYIKYKSIIKGLLSFNDLRKTWLSERIKVLEIQLSELEDKYDIIHCQDPVATYAARNLNKIIVTTIHGPMLEHAKEHGRFDKRYLDYLEEIETVAFSVSKRLIAVDTGQKNILVNKSVPENIVDIIFNSVDVDKTIKNAANFNQENDEQYFVMARRLVPKNGVIFAIETFLDWCESRDVELLVAGDGPLRKKIENLLLNHRNGDKVKLLGNIDNVQVLGLIKNARCSLVPSIPVEGVIEATSLTALESLALNTPLIASDIGGLSEIDRGSNIIRLIKPGNKSDLLNSFDEVLSNKSGSYTRGEEHIRKYFGVAQWIDKHIDVYKKALD